MSFPGRERLSGDGTTGRYATETVAQRWITGGTSKTWVTATNARYLPGSGIGRLEARPGKLVTTQNIRSLTAELLQSIR